MDEEYSVAKSLRHIGQGFMDGKWKEDDFDMIGQTLCVCAQLVHRLEYDLKQATKEV